MKTQNQRMRFFLTKKKKKIYVRSKIYRKNYCFSFWHYFFKYSAVPLTYTLPLTHTVALPCFFFVLIFHSFSRSALAGTIAACHVRSTDDEKPTNKIVPFLSLLWVFFSSQCKTTTIIIARVAGHTNIIISPWYTRSTFFSLPRIAKFCVQMCFFFSFYFRLFSFNTRFFLFH